MQLVVVMAVRKAVSAATTTFTAISITLFFIVIHYSLFTIHYSLAQRLVLIQSGSAIAAFTTRVNHQRTGLAGHGEVTGIDAL